MYIYIYVTPAAFGIILTGLGKQDEGTSRSSSRRIEEALKLPSAGAPKASGETAWTTQVSKATWAFFLGGGRGILYYDYN